MNLGRRPLRCLDVATWVGNAHHDVREAAAATLRRATWGQRSGVICEGGAPDDRQRGVFDGHFKHYEDDRAG